MATTKGAKPVTAIGFKGMNNLPEAAGKLLDQERQITPYIVLNADVTDGGVVQRRGGFKPLWNPYWPIPAAIQVGLNSASPVNCHSVAGEESGLSVMLCVADGINFPQSLYLVEGATATELCEVTGPKARVSYAEINGTVYASNPYWKATYAPLTGAVGTWGVPLPLAPDIALTDGELPPGTYKLCYTNVQGGRLGGNGPLTQIRWEGGQQGIQLKNLPSGALCWITHPDGTELFMAPVSGGLISALAPDLQPLPTFMVGPPPGFSHFVYNLGRIWGARGNKVYYSDPNQYEWFRPGNYFPFLEDIVLLAPVTTGLYVSSLKQTWFLAGEEPDKMVSRRMGNGAIPGTLTMVMVPAHIAGGAATSNLFGKMSKEPTPVWMSPTGFVVGTHGYGNLTYLTQDRLKSPARTKGASLYRIINGIPQVMTSLYGLETGPDDLAAMFTRNRLYIPAPLDIIGSGGIEWGGP